MKVSEKIVKFEASFKKGNDVGDEITDIAKYVTDVVGILHGLNNQAEILDESVKIFLSSLANVKDKKKNQGDASIEIKRIKLSLANIRTSLETINKIRPTFDDRMKEY